MRDDAGARRDLKDPESSAPVERRSSPDPLYCHWLWHTATVLSDGTVTCGLDDPFKSRNHGNLNSATLQDILASDAIAQRRASLTSGIRCEGCALHEGAAGKHPALLAPSRYPKRLVIEPTINCNIRCNNETCNIANAKDLVLRRGAFMSWELFCRLIDEVGPHLEELYFYNYGEPFLHPRALDMLAYARRINPRTLVSTSTNGILLARDGKAERIAAEGLVDFITFTIGGVDQETYARYHKAGSFEKAMLGMRRLLEERRRIGVARPIVHWRYLLFNWNDSDACLAQALRLSEEYGVDEFRYMLTGSPIEGRSLRRAPGTPGFAAIKPWLTFQEGYRVEPFAEAGLWGTERCAQNGLFSWTTSHARVAVTPRDGRVTLRLAGGGPRERPASGITIHLPWGAAQYTVEAEPWNEYEFLVPEQFTAASVPVEIDVEKPFTPRHHGSWGDNRELGVMLSLTDVAPAPNPYRASAVSSVQFRGTQGF
jgi:hypothetical protein